MDTLQETSPLEADEITVRTMAEADLSAVVEIDAAATGRRRPEYFGSMLRRALEHSSMQISLVAEVDAKPAGFVLASLYSGEFGILEPAATIDAIGVDPKLRSRGVGRALVRQLRLNLGALRVPILRTEVSWDDFGLLAFLRHEGFRPAERLCLETRLDPTRSPD